MTQPTADSELASAPAPRHDRPVSLVVLGADVLLRARPATAVQLAHACRALGFQAAVPSSWGDELLANACLEALAARRPGAAVFCACPRVAHRLLSSGGDLAPAMISLVSPPVAVARYLRAIYAPARVRITFAGGCPGGGEDALDARLTAQELFDRFLDLGIVVSAQPLTFDAVLPPDRRRHLSLPGGVPAPEVLADVAAYALHEAAGDDVTFDLAQALLDGEPRLLDPSVALGCSCAGAAPALRDGNPRVEVMSLEPPRAASPVVDARLVDDLELRLPLSPRTPADLALPPAGDEDDTAALGAGPSPWPMLTAGAPATHASPARGVPAVALPPLDELRDPPVVSRRRSPPQGVLRVPAEGPPASRAPDGRLLPRAYVARRKAGPWKRSAPDEDEALEE